VDGVKSQHCMQFEKARVIVTWNFTQSIILIDTIMEGKQVWAVKAGSRDCCCWSWSRRNYADVIEAAGVCGCEKLVYVPIPATKSDRLLNKDEAASANGNGLCPNQVTLIPQGVLALGVHSAPEIKR
jgi:hypothetical protein